MDVVWRIGGCAHILIVAYEYLWLLKGQARKSKATETRTGLKRVKRFGGNVLAGSFSISPSLMKPALLLNERVSESVPPRLNQQLGAHRSCDIGRMVNYIAVGAHAALRCSATRRFVTTAPATMENVTAGLGLAAPSA